ncbi:2-oxoglutarate dehydrogenase complex dihydrolipoyllysine-residue succinyltransferase [Fictibacillus phosphorivorans]|uniref:2-oxoglutarate dehydrogenase complex dihydrolipoyllysine-residue succinyltransferase n=1 Tax=Fictibacillus phosphorivorans TaxID=1221500 RepID=UPI002041B82D|nr:2-oxoglutarate dehydrogenase complex dihydrolipoyllysine-residue succinyltransferase [Fictibacillus phosphorivorans]MCM3719316.1 2-oxoglutarate dehydrogenase complex dihydrolipoyllysine-residue succinyltransferase [Fictibacillus phosphorivorans]MCM3776937.1 2-oxoglutarate dehydrogenase complex dihydrolipoyllysine-residue succinyltransferase [Fictibacillus phosphorivorans]
MFDVKVPELAESISEGTVAQWLKKEGEKVVKGEDIVELETDKVNIEISAERDGILKNIKVEPGDTVAVGDVIASIVEGDGTEAETKPEAESKPATEEKAESAKKQETSSEKEEVQEEDSKAADRPIASPAARKLAREKGIDLSEVSARDPLGRVRTEDVKRHAEGGSIEKTSSKTADSTSQQQPKAETVNPEKPVERVKMSRRRQTIAKRLVEAQQTAAMLTTFNEVDMTAINEVRARRKDKFYEQNGVKLGYMSFFTKAVVGALKKFPAINAEIQGDEMVLKKYYDIGIAVGAEEGLVVPVVRNADRLSFAGIEKEIGNLAEKARTKKLSLEDLQGGSFTITNGGIFGSMLSTPILNAPQVGILGMHTIQWRPVAIDKERMENRPMMYIALSYDHRIVDGKEAVSFLTTVKSLLEDPESLLLEG